MDICHEEYEQESPTRIEIQNEKQQLPTRTETQNTEDENTTHPSNTTPVFTGNRKNES